ncbi:MAG: transposase [Clostridia bacterium]
MPREARRHGESGIYHVMLRGINLQRIFEDEEDNLKFLEVLQDCQKLSGFGLLAYCLMGNHVHLVIKEGIEPLEQVFKRIGSRYVYWYNWKYGRSGHLFQDRYKSEPIDDETYLFTVIRYLHQNPVQAGICKNMEDYPYSSYMQYLKLDKENFIDAAYIFNLIDKESFLQFHLEESDSKVMDIEERKTRLTDEQARKIIWKYAHCKNVAEFQALDLVVRDKNIKKLKEQGLSIRQISRLTGISFGVIRAVG